MFSNHSWPSSRCIQYAVKEKEEMRPVHLPLLDDIESEKDKADEEEKLDDKGSIVAD